MRAPRRPILIALGTLFAVASLALVGCAVPRPGVAGLNNASAAVAIKSRMLRSEADFGGVDVIVVDGVALLTGRVPDQPTKDEAGRIAWSAPNIRDVGNELSVDADGRRLLGANDQLLASQVRARLLADGAVRSDLIHLEVHDGVVYLLGRARSASEAEAAAQAASVTPGVERVVSFLGERVPAVGAATDPRPYDPYSPPGAVSNPGAATGGYAPPRVEQATLPDAGG